MTARDFEDLLLCAIPCFAGLFPPDVDAQIQRLLYCALEWHGLAAARQHSDSSVTLLHNATIRLGTAMRHFRDVVCPQFKTVETPSEVQRRQRAATRAAAAGVTSTISDVSAQRPKTMNLDTFKFHSMGDYPALIPEVGTTDSVSTQTVCLPHPNTLITDSSTRDRANLLIAGKSNTTSVHPRRTLLARLWLAGTNRRRCARLTKLNVAVIQRQPPAVLHEARRRSLGIRRCATTSQKTRPTRFCTVNGPRRTAATWPCRYVVHNDLRVCLTHYRTSCLTCFVTVLSVYSSCTRERAV